MRAVPLDLIKGMNVHVSYEVRYPVLADLGSPTVALYLRYKDQLIRVM